MESHSHKKLRNSCDRCSLLKVRCTKQRSSGSCDRCSKAHEPCHFSGFRWKGRPARPATPPEPLTISGSSVDEGLYATHPNSTPHGFIPADLTTPPGFRSVSSGISLGAFHVPSHAQQLPLSDAWEALQTHGGGGLMNVFGMDVNDSPDTASTSAVPASNGTSSVDDGARDRFQVSLASSSPMTLEGYECHEIVLGLLDELHHPDPQCTPSVVRAASSTRMHSPRSSKLVMKSNKAVLQHLDIISARACRGVCLQKASFKHLIQSVCLTILEWYENVFRSLVRHNQCNHHETPPAPASGEITNGSTQTEGPVVFEPIQFSGFPLGRQAELRLNTELLLCELETYASSMDSLNEAMAEANSSSADIDRGSEATGADTKPLFLREASSENLKEQIRKFRDGLS